LLAAPLKRAASEADIDSMVVAPDQGLGRGAFSIVTGTYNYWLVLLSVAVAVFVSYTALSLSARVARASGASSRMWAAGGAVAMGCGIWSMHFIGMLAYRLPVQVYYHVPTVILSLVAAIAASLVALFMVSRPSVSVLHVIVGSLLIAGGISGMHYTGMAAMRLPAMHQWDPTLVIMSVAVALIVALAALGLTFMFREEGHDQVLKGICAIIMGFAVPAMHYTGMAAVSFKAMPETPDLSNSVDISGVANSAIIAVTFVVLGSVFLVSRWFAPAQEPSAAEA
jgi:two-component system, sensor histidine kinase and response regulator